MLSTIHTLLVANRGEIAVRVLRTAQELGLRTVAIHTDLDADARHVRMADVAVRVPSYMDIDAVVEVARTHGADAVHPGYGFLSERAAFARALEEAGIRLVGPSADVMDAMGRKDHAREVAVAAGVPVVPSYDLGTDPDAMAYPVLVKAAAGGGGKGMRVVHAAGDLAEAREAAARESAGAFGDDTLLIEKYVESGRHIEVQVLGDTHGTVVHLWERDCSTQRRHQKVLEEAPAPTLSEEQRQQITAAGVALAREVGYVNAGTVEFLLDNATGEFYFLEMNTRLQVEHPVTEAITGLDLVREQLLVTDGQPLSFTQEAVARNGHSVEARIYAEDSFGGFLPQAGTVSALHWPTDVRVDHALEAGQVVSTSYDPMLGKVVAWGEDRDAAIDTLVRALDDTAIFGLTTNTGFLRGLLHAGAFRLLEIDTAWLDREELEPPSDGVAPKLALLDLQYRLASEHRGPWEYDGFRMGGPSVRLSIPGVGSLRGPAHSLVSVEELDGMRRIEGAATVHYTERRPRYRGFVRTSPGVIEVVHRGQRFSFEKVDPFRGSAAAVGDGTLIAPMPGTVLAVRVAEGDEVEEGAPLGTVEAMKMELTLKAPFAGVVSRVGASVGDSVTLGQVLFEVEAS